MTDILLLSLSSRDWNRISKSLGKTTRGKNASCCLKKGLIHFLHQLAMTVHLSSWCQSFLMLYQRHALGSLILVRSN